MFFCGGFRSWNLQPTAMYWMTDRTPFEWLPLKETRYCQFFQLVTSQVGLWFTDNSTPNPNGVKPDPNITKIVKGNEFDQFAIEIIDEAE